MSDTRWTGRAPGRVNLIGEHVDYLGGQVLPCAIDRFLTVRGRRGERWTVSSPVRGALPYAEALGEELDCPPQQLEVESTVPPQAGVSSSAALLVAITAGIRPEWSGEKAAVACQRAEQRATGVQVGVMDQFASALGRRGHALLLDCATLAYSLVPFPEELLIAVLDSGMDRALAGTPYNLRRQEAESGHPKRRRHVDSELARVKRFASALQAGDLSQLGSLLKASHRSLRDDFECSTPEVDALVQRAWRAPGCLGARIMGGGFGGSIVALLARGSEVAFSRALRGVPLLLCETADGPYAARAGRP
ncbi:MAG: galactokinase [Candidatus Dormibacteraeota bacterium]|nr:galactokinase [Candidatus Dormibacteraeota bacterium]